MSDLSTKKPSPRAALSLGVFALLFLAVVAAQTDTGRSARPLTGTVSYHDAPLVLRWASLARQVRAAAVKADEKLKWR